MTPLRPGTGRVVLVSLATHGGVAWLQVPRIAACALYPIDDWDDAIDPCWWLQWYGRDVTLWPTDALSGAWMGRMADGLLGHAVHRHMLSVLRWQHGTPEVPGRLETLWRETEASRERYTNWLRDNMRRTA